MRFTFKDESKYEKIYKGRDTSWEGIFDCEKRELEFRKKHYYDCFTGLRKEDYCDILSCVEKSKEQKNHLAFARYFLEKCACEEILFVEKFREHIGNITYLECDKESFWCGSKKGETGLSVIKGSWFRDRTHMNEEKESSRNPSEEREGFVSCQNLRKWYQGENCPRDRYEIVQCAFYLSLTVEETDELLNLAGMPKLYPVNLIDYLCIYYLLKFEKENKQKGKELSIEIAQTIYENYIKKLKKKVNEVLGKYDELEEVPHRNITIKTGTTGKVVKQVYLDGIYQEEMENGKKKMEFKGHVKRIKELIDKMTNSKGDPYEIATELWLKEHKGGKITELYKELLAKNNEELVENEEYLKNSTIGFYELQRQLFTYIDQFESYQKNLFVNNISLAFQENLGVSSLKILKERLKNSCLNEPCWKIYKQNEEQEYLRDDQKRLALEYIWRFQKGAINNFSNLTPIYRLLYGRAQGSESKEGLGRYFEPDFSRKNLIHFCLASGQEDRIDTILNLAGYLECGIEKAINDAKYNSRRDQGEEVPKRKEAIGAFVQYAIMYREKLLQHWQKDQPKTIEEAELRKDFPMIQLFREINRDIQFVVEYFGGCYELLEKKGSVQKIEQKTEQIREWKNECNKSKEENKIKEFKEMIEKEEKEICEMRKKIRLKKNDPFDNGNVELAVLENKDMKIRQEIGKLYKLERDATIYIYPVI